jgi:nicotinate phosphoribosyltransferase
VKERLRPPDAPAKRPFFGWVSSAEQALLTDLYEITMLQAYWRAGMNGEATFDFIIRSLPPVRRFLVVAGLEPALAYLESVKFPSSVLEALRELDRFDTEFLAWLGSLRFTGEVWAMPEGEIAFGAEPIVRVTAPLPEAQFVETFLLNTIAFETAIASKAARVCIAAGDKPVVDFSARRDHGVDAALKAARAAYIGGTAATSNLLAGHVYGIPVTGTMAHSFVLAHEDEQTAFEAYASEFPADAVLLVDTYDSEQGIAYACDVGRAMLARGTHLSGIRIDSGDIASLARSARRVLNEAGLHTTRIFASGDLNETKIASLVLSGTPIDAFGVGTDLGVPADAPALGAVYKLAEYAGTGRAKRSHGKVTLPGRKQVWRGPGFADVIELASAGAPAGEPLLRQVMRRGKASIQVPALNEARERCASRLASLPNELRELTPGPSPDATLGPALRAAAELP